MSKENVKAFIALVEKNEEVRNKLNELLGKYEGKALTWEEKSKLTETLVLPFAKENGLPFNMEDWIDFMKESETSKSSEVMSDDELDSVAGGYIDNSESMYLYAPDPGSKRPLSWYFNNGL